MNGGPACPCRRRAGCRTSLLRRQGDDAVGCADRQEVHHARLERDQRRAEGEQQQHERQPDDTGDEERDPAGDVVALVDEGRGQAADVDTLRCQVAQPIDEVGGLGVLGRVAGITENTAPSPSGLVRIGVTKDTPFSWRTRSASASSPASLRTRRAAAPSSPGRSRGSRARTRRASTTHPDRPRRGSRSAARAGSVSRISTVAPSAAAIPARR